MSGSQVIFAVGRGNYSFDSMKVRAVVQDVDMRVLPGAPECITGIAMLRGELIPVCDLNKKFNTGAATASNAEVIFVNTEDGCLGCTVDRVVEIGAVTEDLELELPYLIRNEKTEYVSEIVRFKGGLVTSVNADKLLDAGEIATLNTLMKKVNKQEEDRQKQEAERLAKEKAEQEAKEEAEKAGE